jgi:hypothetical protein
VIAFLANGIVLELLSGVAYWRPTDALGGMNGGPAYRRALA